MKLNSINIVVVVLGIMLLCVAGAKRARAADNSSRSDKPNIIFIMADDLGPEWISCYGAEDIKTPHIDHLAATGMRFLNAYSMPKCTPTRATLLTGQYPFRHGWVNHWDVPRWGAGCHFDPKHNVTFARVMKSAGYTTAIAGKWQINDFRVQPKILEAHGFDDWCMWTGYESGNKPSGKRYWDPYIHTRDGSKTYSERFGTDVFVDFLIGFMKKNKDKPMCIYFPMALPHGPIVATPKNPKAKSKMDKFKSMVGHIDDAVGRITKALEDLGLRDNTILIFTTDNGTAGGIKATLNGRVVSGGKGKISENGCWEPFIVSCPGKVPAGVTTEALTDFSDLLPTFAELGGAKLPEGVVLDGRSIAKVILGKDKEGPRKWMMAMGGGVAKLNSSKRVIPAKAYAARVIRDQRFKLWVDESGKAQHLYDIKADPGERNDLLSSRDKDAVAALKKFQAVVAGFPSKDGAPRYDPTPPQKWDRKK